MRRINGNRLEITHRLTKINAISVSSVEENGLPNIATNSDSSLKSTESLL